MLVLSRKTDQKIVINDQIVLTVVAIRGDKVRLGIEAPPNVPIHRKEIYDAIQKTSASESDPDASPTEGS